MRLLLDTHIYLWWINNSKQLPEAARSLIYDATEVYISSVSIWEICIKVNLGKLDANIEELAGAITSSGFKELSVTTKHAVELSRLPDLHRDPFDRMLMAQAMSEPLKFLTVDEKMKEYSELVEIV